MSVGLATLHKLAGCLVMHLLIHMNLYSLIPAAGDDCMILTTVADERNLAITWIVLFKVENMNTRLHVINFELALRASNNHFAMVLIKRDAGYF